MRRLSFYVCAVALASQLIPLGFAQQASVTTVPNLIRYGGALKAAQGAPLTSSTVGVTFAIYSQQEGGAAVWVETQNVTTDATGNYSVLLGATTATGLPGDLFSQQEQRWLGVQVQGEPEQARVMMVSVPYAFKAHEADTLGGRSVSDFVLANGATSAANSGSTSQTAPGSVNNLGVSLSGISNNTATMDGPTDFSGSTTDQIVGVTQSGTGVAINASADSKAIVGTATDPTATAYGVQGVATGTAGVGLIGTASSATGFTYGLRGTSSSTSGTGVRGIDNATSGSTIGISGYVSSATGTAGVFNNAAGGNILLGQNNGTTTFTVNGSGNVNAAGGFTGSGTGITGLKFSQLTDQLGSSQFTGTYSNAVMLSNTGNMFSGTSFTGGTFTGSGSGLTGVPAGQLSGTLASAQFSGTYSNAVMLNSTANVFYGNGANLTGLAPAMGSASYIQNQNTAPQSGANFDISGNGTLGSYLTAYGGVSGIIKSATGNAVFGSATTTSGTANGVSGQAVSPTGTGVYGTNTATSGNAYGVAGYTASTAQNASGVYGQATPSTGATNGIFGLTNSSDPNADGVYGKATSTTGSANGVTGFANSLNGYGVWGIAASTDTSGTAYGVYGQSITGPGVYGVSTATSGSDFGVEGTTTTPTGSGVYGLVNLPNGNAVLGINQATTGSAVGVAGESNGASASGIGVYGTGSGYGVFAGSGSGYGVWGQSATGVGIQGTCAPSGSNTCFNGVAGSNLSTSGAVNGVWALTQSPAGSAVYMVNNGGGNLLFGTQSNGGSATFYVQGNGGGYFGGAVQIDGNLNVGGTLSKGGGSFKIDDPLDPANKTLSHSFVESPDMKNIYDGIARLDARGEAWVTLPQYFEALNRDFRYQLTSVGSPQPRLYIAREVKGNRFKIAGGKANAKVSWMVTGIRQDAWANAHRIPNEEDKPLEKRGTYLHPELFGAVADKQTNAMLRQ